MEQKAIQPGWVQHEELFENRLVKPTDRFEPVGREMRTILIEAGFRLDVDGRLIGRHLVQDQGLYARIYRQHVGYRSAEL